MELELILTEVLLFKLSHFRHSFFLHSRVWSLCNLLLLQISVDVSQILCTYCCYIEDMYLSF